MPEPSDLLADMKWRLTHPWKQSAVEKQKEDLREFVAGLAIRSLGTLDTVERKSFMESEICRAFGFRKVEILLKPEGPERFSSESIRVRDVLSRVLGILEGSRQPYLNSAVARGLGVFPVLGSMDATYVFPLRAGESRLGVLSIDSFPIPQLASEVEQILLSACSQVAIVIENSRLLEGKLQLQHALSQQAQMVQLGQMTARIAHEIKNPLSAIKTIVQLMQEDQALQPKYSRDLELINSEMDRLGNTVMQLLNFAKPAPENQDKVRLRDAADAALRFLDKDLQRGRLIVHNDIPHDLPVLSGSLAAFREIFLNLVLNALQAGGDPTHLWLQAWEGILGDSSERFLLLVLEDDGPGIPKEIQEKVFTPFFTTKQRGTGLGLAIVKRDVEHMGGRITLESPVRVDRGTRFLLHLPLC